MTKFNRIPELSNPRIYVYINVSVNATVFLHAVKVSVPRRGAELFRAVRIPQDAGRFLLHVQLCHQRGRYAFVSLTRFNSLVYFSFAIQRNFLSPKIVNKFRERSTNRKNGTDHRREPIKVENLTESGGLSVLLESSLDDYFYPIFPSAEWKVIFHQPGLRNFQFRLCVHPHPAFQILF